MGKTCVFLEQNLQETTEDPERVRFHVQHISDRLMTGVGFLTEYVKNSDVCGG